MFKRASKISEVRWFIFENPDSYETICGDRFELTATRPTFRNKGNNGGHDSNPASVLPGWNILEEVKDCGYTEFEFSGFYYNKRPMVFQFEQIQGRGFAEEDVEYLTSPATVQKTDMSKWTKLIEENPRFLEVEQPSSRTGGLRNVKCRL